MDLYQFIPLFLESENLDWNSGIKRFECRNVLPSYNNNINIYDNIIITLKIDILNILVSIFLSYQIHLTNKLLVHQIIQKFWSNCNILLFSVASFTAKCSLFSISLHLFSIFQSFIAFWIIIAILTILTGIYYVLWCFFAIKGNIDG